MINILVNLDTVLVWKCCKKNSGICTETIQQYWNQMQLFVGLIHGTV